MPVVLPENTRWIKIVLHALFLVSGAVTVLIGQLLPIMAAHFHLSDLQLSLYFPSQFAGSVAGTFFNTAFARRNQYLLSSMIGGF
jgi:fucose permease